MLVILKMGGTSETPSLAELTKTTDSLNVERPIEPANQQEDESDSTGQFLRQYEIKDPPGDVQLTPLGAESLQVGAGHAFRPPSGEDGISTVLLVSRTNENGNSIGWGRKRLEFILPHE